MKNSAKEMTNVDIITELRKLEQQIDLRQLKIEKLTAESLQLQNESLKMLARYEELREEIIGRFPGLEKSPEFKRKG